MTPGSLQARANAAVDRKDWPAAAEALRGLAALAPHVARTWIDLSYVESFSGRYRAAHEAIAAAARAPQRTPGDIADLIARLRTFNDAAGVQAIAKTLMLAPSPDAGLLSICALQLSNLNDHVLALACAEAAVSRQPGSANARLARGQMLAQHGDIDGATADFEACVAQAPGMAAAWWSLARLRRQSSDANHVASLRRLLAMPGLPPRDAAFAGFALHKELDDLGDHAGAWQALEQACEAKRGTLNYAAAGSRALVDALISLPALPWAADARAGGKTPIFIVGMHRSGTTLLEQLLDAHPQVQGVGELYDFTSAMRHATDHHCQGVIDDVIVARARGLDLSEVGRRYLDGMAWRLGGQSHFTDKLPSNFLNVGFICQALPQAKILRMSRDPVETCFSNLRELFSDANPYSYDQSELADYYLQHRRLMAHWDTAYPGRILDVDYAELTRDPGSVMRRIASFCGIDYIDAMRDPRNSTRVVATASVMQVRDRIVRRDVPKWAPYARQLQPLVTALRRGGVEVPGSPA
ncbi:MAG TPA: sulfotransferase [Thermomonas sp.]|nr:sulfotransferase [Thermomonas sp.]